MEQGGLSEEEMQLAIALPVSVGGYLVILFILAVVCKYVDHCCT
jgi:hypothetical protein